MANKNLNKKKLVKKDSTAINSVLGMIFSLWKMDKDLGIVLKTHFVSFQNFVTRDSNLINEFRLIDTQVAPHTYSSK